MKRVVVDASVAVKWFLSEDHSREALLLLESAYERIAPEFIAIEVASVLRKRFLAKKITNADGEQTLVDLLRLVGTKYTAHLVPRAFQMAITHGCSAYDALYVALAVDEGCQLVTADRRLYNALAPHLPETMLWIEDVPEPTG